MVSLRESKAAENVAVDNQNDQNDGSNADRNERQQQFKANAAGFCRWSQSFVCGA